MIKYSIKDILKKNKKAEILTCPFCGGKLHIQTCNEEGEVHTDEYLKNSNANIWYCIIHSEIDVPNWKECPIATEFEDEPAGGFIYDSKEEMIMAFKNKKL